MRTISMNLVAHGGKPRAKIGKVSKGRKQEERFFTSLEPQKTDDTSYTNVLLEHVGNPHSRVQQFLPTLVRDSRDESGRFTNQTKLLCPLVIHRNHRRLNLALGLDRTVLHQSVIGLLENLRKLFESIRNNEPCSRHGFVLCISSFHIAISHTTSMAELDLSRKHLSASADRPCNNRLADDTLLYSLDDAVFLNTADLTKEDQHLALGVLLIAKKMVDKGRAWVTDTT